MPGGNHTFPAELKVEFMDIERNLSVSSVQSLSHVWLFATPWTAACQASLSISNFRRLLKLTSVTSVMPSNRLILFRPLLLLPSVFPSIRVFSNESVLRIRWPKYYSFSFSISSLLIVYSFFSVLIKHFLYLINPCI